MPCGLLTVLAESSFSLLAPVVWPLAWSPSQSLVQQPQLWLMAIRQALRRHNLLALLLHSFCSSSSSSTSQLGEQQHGSGLRRLYVTFPSISVNPCLFRCWLQFSSQWTSAHKLLACALKCRTLRTQSSNSSSLHFSTTADCEWRLPPIEKEHC